MKIEVGMRFSVDWVGHEDCYKDRVYEVLSIIRDCHCSHPRVWLHKTHNQTPTHIHIRAKRVDTTEIGESYFGFIDEDLRDIYAPNTYHLQIESTAKPIQQTLF